MPTANDHEPPMSQRAIRRFDVLAEFSRKELEEKEYPPAGDSRQDIRDANRKARKRATSRAR
jgi:hypothetical protein